jgi:hypothetical protein
VSDLNAFREPVTAMLQEGRSIDEVMVFLRAHGCSKVDCMWALEDFAGMSHVEAKTAVHESEAWATRRANDEALHEQLERELRDAADERPDGTLELP